MKVRTIAISSGVALAVFAAIMCATWGFHVIDRPIHDAVGRSAGNVIINAVTFLLPIAVMAGVKAMFARRFAGWLFILVPAAVAPVIGWLAVLAYFSIVIGPNLS